MSKLISQPGAKPPAEVKVPMSRVRNSTWTDVVDTLASEEPMEIRLAWSKGGEALRKSIAVTMRTPGDDFALAAGFLYGEGILRDAGDVVDIAYCQDEDEPQRFNIVTVTLRPGLTFDPARLERNVFANSSCGVCGKANLEALELVGCEPLPAGLRVSEELIGRLPAAIRDAQGIFSRTGGLHAAALFQPDGTLLNLKEDVGRHNALDKLIGTELLEGRTPLEDQGVILSGRAGFELLQKALMARIPLVVALGAPSSLAVSLASEFGITLVGFTKPGAFNVYSRPDRIESRAHRRLAVARG